MSLQLAANHLAAHGRGPDTTLVHMSRDEVKGLNDLAMAHGGQLTINPQTGLPEAGFLSSLLPMIGGAALSAMGMPPMMASLVMGGITGVSSGSLSKGLMAGLGAYGGAGLMGGLMGAGADVAAQSAYGAASAGTDAAAQAAGFGTAEEMAQIQAANAMQAAKTASPFSTAWEGAKGLGSEAGRSSFMNNLGGGKELLKYGMAAAAPVLAAPQTATKQPEIKADTDPGQRYTYSPGRTTTTDADPYSREQTYFQPKFSPITPTTAKSIYGYAGGGPIEAMSDANAVGANTGYPMADINKGAYATPYQTPISRNVLSGAADTGVNPMTGEMAFADGGEVAVPDKYSYDPLTQMFKKIEEMPSDNQVQTNQPAQPLPTGGGYVNPQQQAKTDAFFNNMTPQQQADHAAMNKTVAEGLASALTGGLSSTVNTAKNFALNANLPGTQISPLAVPSLAAKSAAEAINMPANLVAFKTSPPNPNPNAVQVVDAGDMVSPSALGDTQAKADANNAQQVQAISAALSALQGVGPSSSAATSAGIGGIGGIGGAPGAPALGVNSGGGYAISNAPAGDGDGGAGVGGGGGGGGGGVGGGVASGSGGGAAAMGTGAHGMAAGAGAARGGLMAAYAAGGSHLGDYSDGGRLLRGPGDGVSDSIPAMIGKKQPARLADGEFVIPARIVSELGNGSTEAGARKLYAMMDRVQKARGKTVGKGRVANNSRADKHLPA